MPCEQVISGIIGQVLHLGDIEPVAVVDGVAILGSVVP